MHYFFQKLGWTTVWEIFSPNHPFTLLSVLFLACYCGERFSTGKSATSSSGT
jgi:hypothetical protein